jgi:hypothetical protein
MPGYMSVQINERDWLKIPAGQSAEVGDIMADRQTHCADCKERLGEGFPQVHAWLDELIKAEKHKTGLPWGDIRLMQHRIYRHHQLGVETVREKWGEKAAQAAIIHIKRDFGLLDHPSATDDDFPKNQRHAEILLKFYLEDQIKRAEDEI